MRVKPLILLAKLAFFATVAAALWFALTPSEVPRDKAVHFGVSYAVTLLDLPAFPRAPLWPLALALPGFGAALEGVQALPPFDREAQWGDLVADLLGVAFALAPVAAWRLREAGRAEAGRTSEAAPLAPPLRLAAEVKPRRADSLGG